MNEALAAQPPKAVPAVEQVLNALCSAPPKAGEKVHQFVRRCCSTLNGKRPREQLNRAIMDSLAELGIKATEPASYAQLALNATSEEKAEAEANQGVGLV